MDRTFERVISELFLIARSDLRSILPIRFQNTVQSSPTSTLPQLMEESFLGNIFLNLHSFRSIQRLPSSDHSKEIWATVVPSWWGVLWPLQFYLKFHPLICHLRGTWNQILIIAVLQLDHPRWIRINPWYLKLIFVTSSQRGSSPVRADYTVSHVWDFYVQAPLSLWEVSGLKQPIGALRPISSCWVMPVVSSWLCNRSTTPYDSENQKLEWVALNDWFVLTEFSWKSRFFLFNYLISHF